MRRRRVLGARRISFPISGGNNIINSISIAFGSGAALNGLPYLAVLWSDPNHDGNPQPSQVLRA